MGDIRRGELCKDSDTGKLTDPVADTGSADYMVLTS